MKKRKKKIKIGRIYRKNYLLLSDNLNIEHVDRIILKCFDVRTGDIKYFSKNFVEIDSEQISVYRKMSETINKIRRMEESIKDANLLLQM